MLSRVVPVVRGPYYLPGLKIIIDQFGIILYFVLGLGQTCMLYFFLQNLVHLAVPGLIGLKKRFEPTSLPFVKPL